MTLQLAVWVAAAVGYLVGSIPFGLVLCRLAGYGDIRKIGSGNIGATNVLRTGNKPLAFATLVLDIGKGAAAVLIAGHLAGELAGVVAGTAAVLGHNFPLWLRFKGGKGVATTLGTLTAIAWPVGLACGATWLLVAAIGRMSSLSGMVSLALAPVYAWYLVPFGMPGAAGAAIPVTIAAAILGALSCIRHRANIARIARGEEPRINFTKT